MVRFKSISIISKLLVISALIASINIFMFLLVAKCNSTIRQYTNALLLTQDISSNVKILKAGVSYKDSTGLSFVEMKDVSQKVYDGLFSLQKGGLETISAGHLELPESYIFSIDYSINNVSALWKNLTTNLDAFYSPGLDISNRRKQYAAIEDQSVLINHHLEGIATQISNVITNEESSRSLHIMTCLLLIVILFFVIWRVFITDLKTPLEAIRRVSIKVAEGDLALKSEYRSDCEIGLVAEALDNIIDNQVKLASFAEEIGEGNFSVDYQKVSDKDKLGISLIGMCDKLKKVNAEEKRRSWANEGYAKFAEILRGETDTKQLCEKILINLVKYINANQGGVFIVDDSDPNNIYLNLISAYAWDRKKHLEKVIYVGEGLIGQTFQEGETIYLTEVPDNFVQITSGLGAANPTSILMVPLKINDSILGVLEIAFLRELEEFEIEFVERLSESIASTLSSVKVNEKTILLLEESRRMTQEMTSQEEELRQNMEELQATQEEMERKELELEGLFSSINNSLSTMEFSMDGNFVNGNVKLISYMGFPLQELVQKPCQSLISNYNEVSEVLDRIWDDLRNGTSSNGDLKLITKDGRDLWMSATFTPVKRKDGVPYKVMVLAQDITEKKKSELAAHKLSHEAMKQAKELKAQEEILKQNMKELEEVKGSLSDRLDEARGEMELQIREIEIEKLKNVGILEGCVDGVISFDQNGVIEFFNKSAEEIFRFKKEEVIGKKIVDIMALELVEREGEFSLFFGDNGNKRLINVRTEVSLTSKTGDEVPVLLTLSNTRIDGKSYFTAFIQSIAVELF